MHDIKSIRVKLTTLDMNFGMNLLPSLPKQSETLSLRQSCIVYLFISPGSTCFLTCKSSYWNTELHPGECLCIFGKLGSQQQARAIQVRALARPAAHQEQSYGLNFTQVWLTGCQLPGPAGLPQAGWSQWTMSHHNLMMD
jgi:hypothetical protein